MNFKNLIFSVVALAFIGIAECRQIRQSLPNPVEAINQGVANNFIGALSRIGSASEVVGTNVSRAAAVLIRGIVREGFNLGGVAAYVPKLLFMDGPNQFVETLRLIRSNQIQALPNDMNSAIDNLITWTGSLRDSGIPSRLSPVVEFFPNIFTGVERFVKDVVYNAFTWVGTLPQPEEQDRTIENSALRVAPSTQATI